MASPEHAKGFASPDRRLSPNGAAHGLHGNQETGSHGAAARGAAIAFLVGKAPLTDAALVGLHQSLYDRALVHSIVAAHRAGAKLGADVAAANKTVRQIVSDRAFDWGASRAEPDSCEPAPGGEVSRGPSPERTGSDCISMTGKATRSCQPTDELDDLERRLRDEVAAEKEALLSTRKERDSQKGVALVAETFASARARSWVRPPDEEMWTAVIAPLDRAHALRLRKGADMGDEQQELAKAVLLFRDAHHRLYEYRRRTMQGADDAITSLHAIEIACDVAVTALSGGAGAMETDVMKLGVRGLLRVMAEQSVREGLRRTAVKAAVTSGVDELVKGGLAEGATYGEDPDADYHVTKVLADAGGSALSSLTGALVSGPLSDLFMGAVGSALSRNLPKAAKVALAARYGVVGTIPPDLFLARGWRFLLQIAGDACGATLDSAVTVAASAVQQGKRRPGARQLADMIVELMVERGLLEIVASALIHESVEPMAEHEPHAIARHAAGSHRLVHGGAQHVTPHGERARTTRS